MDGPGARRTVLVVDDEEDLRDIIRRMLMRRGYDVLAAGTAAAATAVVQEHDGPIDVLVTDLRLPDGGGGELARAVTAVRPAVGVVYISGTTKDLAVADGAVDEDALLVKKPFTAELLITAVGQVLP